MRPCSTASASHATLTWLSRPENPPIAATSVPPAMSCPAAPDWLDTAIVPPPCASTYATASETARVSPPKPSAPPVVPVPPGATPAD
jgi:hypothetical protein